ncbi:MAG: hypothetical protein ACYCU0_06245 [Solirubrobacteraceae bacterium]
MRRIGLTVAGAFAALALAPAAAALAAGAPALESEQVYIGGARTATIEAQIQPSGLETSCAVQYASEEEYAASGWAQAASAPCPHAIAAGTSVRSIQIQLGGLSVATGYRYRVSASNASGATTAPGATFATFGIESFSFEALDEAGEPYTEAGGHPYELVTKIAFSTTHPENPWAQSVNAFVPDVQDGVVRDIELELPPGLIGNPDAAAKCSYTAVEEKTCTPASQIGMIEVDEEKNVVRVAGLFNMVAPTGVAARFGARVNAVANATIEAGVRSGGDYGINADSLQITSAGTVTGVTVRMWGVPAAASHTPERYCGGDEYPKRGVCGPHNERPASAESPEAPFLSMPTSCSGTIGTSLAADSYQAIGDFAGAFQQMPGTLGCGRVRFAPELKAAPTTSAADSPSGLNFDLHVPQNDVPGKEYESAQGPRSSDLRNATVTLPAGMTVNPSSAAGLAGCAPAQISPGSSAQAGSETIADEQQRLEVEPRLDSGFSLAFAGQTTAPLPATASPSSVQTALEALPGIGQGNVQVSGGSGGVLLVRFDGALAGRSVPPLTMTASRGAVESLAANVDAQVERQANDSFALALDGHSTAASLEGTAHLVAEEEETRLIGYIEDASITAESGKLVTGEAITGPGLPRGTRIKLAPGRIELMNASGKDDAPSYYTPGEERTGRFEVSLPSSAFPETIREALEAMPSVGRVSVAGGAVGAMSISPLDSRYTIVYEAAGGYEAQPMTVTPVIAEVPQTLTPRYNAPSTRTAQATVVQQGGVPHLNGQPAACPPASKLGTVEIKTPLLEKPLPGAVYLATPYENPFDSLLALYIAVHDPVSGVVVKLAGHVEANPVDGQLTATFDENPQLPFEDLELKFREGPRAPLATPRACGGYTTTSVFEPWSHLAQGEAGTPDASPTSGLQITSSPSGSCAAGPGFAPSLAAGTSDNVAASFSPFVLRLQRNDGEQAFKSVSTTLPKGLTGEIANVPRCGEAQADAGTCPASTQIGHVDVQAGVGATPLSLPEAGRAEDPVYLTGPYDGAPFGLAIVVHAEAGPFNLGVVVVRAKIEVDPHTAQVTISTPASGPYSMPTFLKGIPVDLRTIEVTVNRPDFILNPTSCEPASVTGTIGAAEGATAAVSSRYQGAGCQSLAFAPKLTAWTQAKSSRRAGASLAVRVRYPRAGEANIAKVKVQLPKKLPTREETLKYACTEAQFAANPAGCPEAARVGSAIAVTPILATPLAGPVYFVSHAAAKFPELVAVLQGEGVTIDLSGETYISPKGITTSTFASVPDEPISSFEMSFPEGPYSAVTALGANLCHDKLLMPTTITAQNGAVIRQTTHIAIRGCSSKAALVSHEIRRRNLKLTVFAPSAGKIKVSGPGWSTRTKTAKGRGTVAVGLTARGRHCNDRTKVTLIFEPKHGKRQRHVYRLRYPATRGRQMQCRSSRVTARRGGKRRG